MGNAVYERRPCILLLLWPGTCSHCRDQNDPTFSRPFPVIARKSRSLTGYCLSVEALSLPSGRFVRDTANPTRHNAHFYHLRRLGHATHEWRSAFVMPLRPGTCGNCHRCKDSQSPAASFSLHVPASWMKLHRRFDRCSQRQSNIPETRSCPGSAPSAIRTNRFASIVQMCIAQAGIDSDPECLVHDSVAVC